MIQELKDTVYEKAKAGYPALYLLTQEGPRSQKEIKDAGKELNREVYIWTLDKGLVKSESAVKEGKEAKDLAESSKTPPDVLVVLEKMALDALKSKAADGKIFVLKNFHHFLDNALIQARILDLIQIFKMTKMMFIITTNVSNLPAELEKELTLVETPLPSKEMLEKVLASIWNKLPADKQPSPESRKMIIEAASGLTTGEAENVFALSIVRPSRLKTQIWDPKVVLEEKCVALKKAGLLEYISSEGIGLKSVGGMKALKEWVSLRKRAFTEEAKTFGLPAPKGILMVGPPGSGKSLGAKAVSSELDLPLIRCDFGKLLGSLVGQSEGNMRKAIEMAEAMSPCVLWIDEIEKALAGTTGGSMDSGVGARLLGYLLTWMQEKTSPVFVYATANDVTGLPPELLRKGRFDEMWSVLLPNEEERREIFDIHLRKRKRGELIGKKIDIPALAKETSGFSGAEIEAVIVEAMYAAFNDKHDLTMPNLNAAIGSVSPLSKTMAEKILKLEDWCKTRTRSANGEETDVKSIIDGSRQVEA